MAHLQGTELSAPAGGTRPAISVISPAIPTICSSRSSSAISILSAIPPVRAASTHAKHLEVTHQRWKNGKGILESGMGGDLPCNRALVDQAKATLDQFF